MSQRMHGVFTIPVTPFAAASERAHGSVAAVNASECPFLSDAERLRVAEIVVETTNRRAPVVSQLCTAAPLSATSASRNGMGV